MNKLVIMEEDLESNFEPDSQEIEEYAEFIGMSPRSDAKYLYIAKQALKTPLPEPWKPASTEEGQIVYVNLETSEVSEEHPLDSHFRRLFIEAKQRDTQGQTGKKSKKLHNLVQEHRAEDEGQKPTNFSQNQSQLSNPNSNHNSNYNSNYNSNHNKKQLDLLAGSAYESPKLSDLEIKNYETEKEQSLLKYRSAKQDFFQKQAELIKSSQTNVDYDDQLQLRKSQMMEEKQPQSIPISSIEKKNKIKQDLIAEYDRRFQESQQKVQQEQQKRIDQFEKNESKKLNEAIKLFETQERQKLSDKKTKIEQLKKDLKAKQLVKKEMLQKREKILKEKWEKKESELKTDIKVKNHKKLEMMKIEFENAKIKISAELKQFKKESIQKLNSQQNSVQKKKFQLKELFKQKYLLEQQSLNQELHLELREEENDRRKILEEELEDYATRQRSELVWTKSKKIDKLRQELTEQIESELSEFKRQVLAEQSVKFEMREIENQRSLNDSKQEFSRESSKQQEMLKRMSFEQLDIAQKIKFAQASLSKVNEVIQTQRDLIQQLELKLKFAQMEPKNQKQQMLEVLEEKQKEVEDLKKELANLRRGLYRERSFQGKENYDIQEWLSIIEQEKGVVAVYKNRLRLDKENLKRRHKDLLNYSSDNCEEYNRDVEAVRKNQEVLQNMEFLWKEMQKGVQKCFKQPSFCSELTQMYESYNEFKKDLRVVSYQVNESCWVEYQSYEKPRSSSHYQSQSRPYSAKNKLHDLLDDQFNFLTKIKQQCTMYRRR